MPSTSQYLSAKHDQDLLVRIAAQAEMMGVDQATDLVQKNLAALMRAPIGPSDTIVSVYAYASEVRQAYIAATPPAPGANLGAVTDAHLETAINAVLNPAPTEAPA